MQGGRCAAVHEMFADVFFQTLKVNMTATKNESKEAHTSKKTTSKLLEILDQRNKYYYLFSQADSTLSVVRISTYEINALIIIPT